MNATNGNNSKPPKIFFGDRSEFEFDGLIEHVNPYHNDVNEAHLFFKKTNSLGRFALQVQRDDQIPAPYFNSAERILHTPFIDPDLLLKYMSSDSEQIMSMATELTNGES